MLKSETMPRLIAAKIIAHHIANERNAPTPEWRNNQSRHFVMKLSQGVMQNYYPLMEIWQKLEVTAPTRNIHKILMLCGFYEILFLQKPDFAIVNSYVELSKTYGGAKFTNAILRKAINQVDNLREMLAPISPLPAWLSYNIESHYPEYANDIFKSLKQEPALGIIVKANPEKWQKIFQDAGYQTETLYGQALRQPFQGSIEKIPAFDKGEWWIQDFASYFVSQLFSKSIKDKDLLDLCASPGGKSACLAGQGARLTCIDNHENRMKTLHHNFKRLGIKADTQIADILTLNLAKKFPLILLDAPCSALGTFRHNPDIIFKRNPDDLQKYHQTQLSMVKKAWQWLGDDGELLYAVCSLEKIEGEQVIEEFLAFEESAKILPFETAELPPALRAGLCPKGMLTLLPHLLGGIDGFFIARLTKKARP